MSTQPDRSEHWQALWALACECEPDPAVAVMLLAEVAALGCAVNDFHPGNVQSHLGDVFKQLHLAIHAPHLAVSQ